MANDGSVDVLIQKQAIDNVQVANTALEKSLQLILDINKASRGGSATGTSPADAEKINNANRASAERIKLTDQTIVLQKKLLQSEINLKNALSEENKEIIKNRVELQQTNKRLKDAAILQSKLTSELQKAVVKRNQLARTVQDLNLKKSLGNKLTKKETQLLKSSTSQFNKYDKSIRRARQSVGRFQDSVGNYQKGLTSLINVGKSLIGIFGIVEGLRLGARFIKDAAEVSREARGVDFAFENLGDTAQEAFNKVKRSTRGLLSDLAIKKNIILFDNFNISLEQMGDLMEFAAIRSTQTGESMDLLAQSIATGLGRESVLILDNLGINTKELRGLMDDLNISMTEAFSILAQREMAEAGDILDEATNSQQRFNAAFENFQISAGSGFVGDLTNSFNDLSTSLLTAFTNINNVSDGFLEFIGNVGKTFFTIGGAASISADAAANSALKERLELLGEISEVRIKQAKQSNIILTQSQVASELQHLNNEELREMLKLLSDSGDAGAIAKTIDFYEELISETKSLRDSTAETTAEYKSFTKTIEDAERAMERLKGTFQAVQKVQGITPNVPSATAISGGGISGDGGTISESVQKLGLTPEQESERLDKLFELQREAKELTFQLEEEAFFSVADLGLTLLDRKVALIDAEILAEENKYALLFELAEGDKEQQRLLAIEREEELQKLEEKRNKELKKQHLINKGLALADIGIKLAQTLAAINLAAAELDVVTLGIGGNVYRATQIPLAIGIATAQTAAIIATPLPKFAEGGTMHKDGLAVVGDGGRKEVIKNPDGSIQVTPNKSTLVNLKKGAEIIPSIDEFNQDSNFDISDKIYSATVMASLSINNNKINGYLESQKIFNDKLLDAMVKNTMAIKKQKLRSTSQRIDVADELFKMKY